MKRYVSVFEMYTRSSLYKVLAVLAVMVGTQFVSFYLAMQKYPEYVLEDLIDAGYYSWIWKAAYLLITVAIVLPGCNIGTVQDYTLKRLRIKVKRVYFLQGMYNILCYVLLWVTELVVLLLTAAYYINQTENTITNQTLFLAFYRNTLMHSILPLEDPLSWGLLIYICVGTGLAAEAFCRRQREGKIGWELILVVAIMLLDFPRGLDSELVLFLIFMILIPFQIVYRIALNMGVVEDENQ